MTVGTKRALLFAALLAWCALLIGYRMHRGGTAGFVWLLWNLFLAVIPAIAAALFLRNRRAGGTLAIGALWIVVWILFLPNAPYIVTDFVHLDADPRLPEWYDIAMLISCAATGLLLGYSSVADVQTAVTRSHGRRTGWAVAALALLLSGFGIYLGRFVRWNSWDAVTHPGQVVRYLAPRAADPLSHRRGVGVTVIYGCGLVLGYVALRVMASTVARRGEGREG